MQLEGRLDRALTTNLQVLNGEPMSIFGDGQQTRCFSYIDDVAPLIGLSPETPGARTQDFFVGADGEHSVLELSREVAKAMGVPHKVKHLDARKEVAYAYAKHDKLRCVFNPPPAIGLTEGLRRTAAYARKIGRLTPTGFSEIEVPPPPRSLRSSASSGLVLVRRPPSPRRLIASFPPPTLGVARDAQLVGADAVLVRSPERHRSKRTCSARSSGSARAARGEGVCVALENARVVDGTLYAGAHRNQSLSLGSAS